METSSILAFRALNFLVEHFALRFDSDSLRILSGEMEPASGHPSGDPALTETWIKLWGEPVEQTFEAAASVANGFLRREGNWGDDGYERLAEALKRRPNVDGNEVWDAWLYCLDKARRYSDPGAWSF